MAHFHYLVTLSILLSCCLNSLCFQVTIRENHVIQVHPFKTRINKRFVSSFIDKATYSFNGFEKVESIPVIFPLDICIFNVNQTRHVAAMHVNKDGKLNFVIMKQENESYKELFRLATPHAIGMDCRSFDGKGFVALAYNITTSVERATKGSPIFQVDSKRIKIIQYFGAPNLRSVYLRSTDTDLFLLQTFENVLNSQNASGNLFCPYFKWSGHGFQKLGQIPCSNARHLEPFTINSDVYIAVANYADKYGRTETMSEVYKYDWEKKKLISFQKIKTNAAVHVKYFTILVEDFKRMHFLIFGNSLDGGSLQADSVIYQLEEEFVPFQMISLFNVNKFLPIEYEEADKFILLVACWNQDIKIYYFNDGRFKESTTQFTEGALGKGVSNIRIFKDEDRRYLVIANERMLENETNVFHPILEQEEHKNALRKEILDWSDKTIDRLKNHDVEKLRTDLQKALDSMRPQNTSEITEIPSARVGIVQTKSLVSPKRNLTTSYWKALSFAQQALDGLEARANKKYSMKREVSPKEQLQYTHETLSVDTLIVRSSLSAKKINGVDPTNIQFETIAAPKIIVNGDFQKPQRQARSDITPEFPDSLHVDHLKVSGTLNGISWNDLQTNTLKLSGQQILKAPINLNTLKANNLVITSNTINGRNLSNLMLIDGGHYSIDQEIHFMEPIFVENMMIKTRLNNIPVFNDKLDVLLLNSDEVQRITGNKTFEDIKLLEPVTISGKIFGELDVMSPFKPIHDSIHLVGDYTITGDVTVKESLSANDIVGSSRFHSIKKVLEEGLPLSNTLSGLNLRFLEPIVASHTIASAVNGHDLEQLVRVDSEEVQIIKGQKRFKGNLQVSKGIVEAKTVNGVDIDNLESRLLTKSGAQNITGNLRFQTVIAKSIESPSVQLEGRPSSDYLTKSGDQNSEGSLKVKAFQAKQASFENLQTDLAIFGHDLRDTKNRGNPDPAVFQNFPGTIYVQNFRVEGSVNGNPVEDIERWFTQLEGNVKYVGNLRLRHDIKVPKLTFTGRFNGIPAEEFGSCWLQQGKDQIFTAPQIFDNVKALNGVQLSGKLNGHEFREFVSGTYKTDRNENIADVTFESSIVVDGLLNASSVNGLRIPEDILVTNPPDTQVLNEPIICQRSVHVKGNIRILSTVNNISLALLNNHLDSELDTLTVQHAIFDKTPTFATLNEHDLRETMDSVWFANVDTDLQHHVEMTHAYFKEPLDFHGPINGMNLKYVKENYFSLSRPQQVTSEILFSREVTFANDLDVGNLHVYGPIVNKASEFEFNFEEFIQNSLRTDGVQEITGEWKIFEGSVAGDLNNVRVNGLNLAEDVILYDSERVDITAPKHVRSAGIQNLYCEPGSTVNSLNLSGWIRDSVFIHGNHTIRGTSSINSVTLRGDMQVHGTVNNVTFTEHTLLLRDGDQVIRGDIQIVNEEKGSPLNTFDHLHADSVNGLNVDEFFTHLCRGEPRTHIRGSMKFISPIQVENFRSGSEIIDSDGNKNDFASIHNQTEITLNELDVSLQTIIQSYQGDKYYLSHFEQRQVLQVPAKQVISLTLRIDREFVDIIGILSNLNADQIQFYRWDPIQQQFIADARLGFLPRNKALIDIFRAALGKADYLAMEKSIGVDYEGMVSTDTEGLQEIFKNNASRFIEALKIDGEDCFVTCRNNDGAVVVYCMEIVNKRLRFVHRNTLKRDGVRQISSLDKDVIVVLLDDSVEIWKPAEPERPIQKILAASPSQLASVVSWDSTRYLAICSRTKPETFHHGLVDIYRSHDDGPFELIQTIDIVSPLQVEFALLPESNDILLYILTDSYDEPLAIYYYRGVSTFQPIVTSSTLPPASAINTVHLKANHQHLVSVITKDDITFIEPVLAKT